MDISEKMLHKLETGDEQYKLETLKKEMSLRSDRAARVILHIIETNPAKFTEKLQKEISKLENKLIKEYKNIHKKMNSYNYAKQNININQNKLAEIKFELEELSKLL